VHVKQAIITDKAPQAIGTYSQAIRAGNTIYLSGQIPFNPSSGGMMVGDIKAQIERVFDNLNAVAEAAGASLNDAVKLTVYLTDLANFAVVNEVMRKYFELPYPARAVVGVAALPKGAEVEVDAVLVLK
jgi:reactive intermediate/imine deaminase